MDREIQDELERLRWRTLVDANVISRLLAALEQAKDELARLRSVTSMDLPAGTESTHGTR